MFDAYLELESAADPPPEAAASGAVEEIRAGSRVLSVFENPLNTRILRAHTDGPQRLGELQQKISWSAQTTVRVAVGQLCDLGALTKEVVSRSPYGVATALSPAGREMLFAVEVLEDWLARCPGGAIPPETENAKAAIKALAGGWSSSLMRILANGSHTLTELDGLIPELSYPALERRLSWMRATGQVEPLPKRGRGTPYVVTDWLRQAIAPLAAAGRCELRHLPKESGPITSLEVEAAFMLAIPLAPLPEDARGPCVLAAQIDSVNGGEERPVLTGIALEVEQGQVTSCGTEIAGEPTTWGIGAPQAWLDAIIDGRLETLRIGGAKAQLAADLINGLHIALFTDR